MSYVEEKYRLGLWEGELEQPEIDKWFELLLDLKVLPKPSKWGGLRLADISANRGALLFGFARSMQKRLEKDEIRLSEPVSLMFSDKHYSRPTDIPTVYKPTPLLFSFMFGTLANEEIDSEQFSMDFRTNDFRNMRRALLLDGRCDIMFDRLGEAWYNKEDPAWYLFRVSWALKDNGWFIMDGQPHKGSDNTLTPSTLDVILDRFPDFFDTAEEHYFGLKAYRLEHPRKTDYPVLIGLHKEGQSA